MQGRQLMAYLGSDGTHFKALTKRLVKRRSEGERFSANGAAEAVSNSAAMGHIKRAIVCMQSSTPAVHVKAAEHAMIFLKKVPVHIWNMQSSWYTQVIQGILCENVADAPVRKILMEMEIEEDKELLQMHSWKDARYRLQMQLLHSGVLEVRVLELTRAARSRDRARKFVHFRQQQAKDAAIKLLIAEKKVVTKLGGGRHNRWISRRTAQCACSRTVFS